MKITILTGTGARLFSRQSRTEALALVITVFVGPDIAIAAEGIDPVFPVLNRRRPNVSKVMMHVLGVTQLDPQLGFHARIQSGGRDEIARRLGMALA